MTTFICNDVFILMGGENLKKVEEIGPGNIVGLGGLDDLMFNTGTISSV
jgi:translation elongation factor EF-G